MIIFYRIKSNSPNIEKIRLMLALTCLPHRVEYIDPHLDEVADQAFLTASPGGWVPAIVDTDTDVSLFESGAILFYLAEKTGQYFPTDQAERAQVMKWLMFEVANLCPAIISLHHFVMHDTGDIPESVYEHYRTSVANCCAMLDAHLQQREYLGELMSIAELAIFPWVQTLEDIAEISLSDYPALTIWADRVAKQMSVN